MDVTGFSLSLVLLALPSIGAAAESCPWLNAATAGGVLGGTVTGVTVKRAPAGDDASCDFVRHAGSLTLELRIEVETMRSPAKHFSSYAARCHSTAVPLKAIGNEALACSDEGAEQIVGRVRNRAFVVRLRTSDRSTQPAALRDKAREIAEQVAGILF
jgi:hypothetical protein